MSSAADGAGADHPSPAVGADQLPVVGDEVMVRAELRAIANGGCIVRIRAPSRMFQHVLVEPSEVLAPLRAVEAL